MKMTKSELREYREKLNKKILKRFEKFNRAHITRSPAQLGWDKRQDARDWTKNTINDLRSDVFYYQHWLHEDKTSTVKGYESFKRKSLKGLGITQNVSNEKFEEIMEVIDKIRELRPDLAKGSDRFRYRAVFARIIHYMEDLTVDQIVIKLHEKLDEILQDEYKRRERRRVQQEEELADIILNRFDEQPTTNNLWKNVRSYYDKIHGRRESDR